MDPLSITASVIAVINLTGTVTTSLNDLRTAWNNAHGDLQTLLSEIAEFQAVLSSIRDTCTESSADAFLQFSSLCSRAKGRLHDLKNLLRDKILQHVSATGKVPKVRWMRVRGKIEAIRRDLRDIRLQLVVSLTSFTARCALAANTRLEMIEVSIQELGSGQQTIRTEITRSMPLPLPSSSDPAQDPQPYRAGREDYEISISRIPTDLVQPGNIVNCAEATNSQELSRNITPTAPEWHCKPWCACLCHKRHRWQVPKSLHTLLGNLHLSYSGAILSRTPCTERMCRRPSAQNTKVAYTFPAWLAARCTIMADIGGPYFCLRTVSVVPRDAPIIAFARSGNAEGIKTLFRSGLASPFDVDLTGWTPLRHAVGQGHRDACRILLQAGADPAAEQTRADSSISIALSRAFLGQSDFYEIFPLWDAIPEQGYSRLQKIILDIIPGDVGTELALATADIDTPDVLGQTPLFSALLVRKTETVECLLKYDANVNLADVWGCTPLMIAANVSLIDKLILAGADLHAANSWGQSALKYAHLYNYKEVFKRLLYHESQLEKKSELFLQLAGEYGYGGTRVIEDITDESYDASSTEESDLSDTEDFIDATETLSIQARQPPPHAVPQSSVASPLAHSLHSKPLQAPLPPPPSLRSRFIRKPNSNIMGKRHRKGCTY